MNLQQLRSVREAIRRGFNLTEVAQALHTSQPGVSRQIRDLEDELGFVLFVRQGKRLTGLTPEGAQALPVVERLLLEAENLQRLGEHLTQQDSGPLTIATTHTQARYALPPVVRDFRTAFPGVTLTLHQGSPPQVAAMVERGEADIGVATEALTGHERLVTLPCYRWTHAVVVPKDHALARAPLTLEALARWPLITYERGYTGRTHIDEAFTRAGLAPEIVLTAVDSDVIKTYVELGMGVGIITSMAWDPERDQGLACLDAGRLFETNTTRLALRRGHFMRHYVYEFIRTFAPPLTREIVDAAVGGGPAVDYQI